MTTAIPEGALVLAGGGHSHALLLRRWAMQPKRRPHRPVILVSRHSTALYSGMVPGVIAGIYQRQHAAIDLRRLADRAGVALVIAEITGVDRAGHRLELSQRPPLRFGLLSLDVGAETKPTGGMPIKPLEPALTFLAAEDQAIRSGDAAPFCVVGSGLAAVEVVLALRHRWPERSLRLQAFPERLNTRVLQALKRHRIELQPPAQPWPGPSLHCTGSRAPGWLQATGLPVDQNGRLITDQHLQVEGETLIFASGDCAVIRSDPRPASGVWAVRAARPLAVNLEARSRGGTTRPWRPQRQALQLLGLSGSEPQALALRGAWRLGPFRWLWWWKQRIDRRFMAGFQQLQAMDRSEPTEAMACRGCAAKLAASPLAVALSEAGLSSAAQQPEDAAELLTAGTAGSTWLQSVDGFPALVSDPWRNARLTALHACSDLWASGATVTSAQAVITVPAVSSPLQSELLRQTLAGLQSALEPQGAALIGGHTLEARHPTPSPASLGIQVTLCVNGQVRRKHTRSGWSKRGLQRGDQLLLSRPLGTGVLFAAAMQGAADADDLDRAERMMSSSQHSLLEQLLSEETEEEELHACTDITGFGLLGHLGEMLDDDCRLQLDAWTIPSLNGALELLEAGHYSSLAPANRSAWHWLDASDGNAGPRIHLNLEGLQIGGSRHRAVLELLVDPQTCGPLLIGCSETLATRLESLHAWHRIGCVL